jgi:hypothetical protein
MHRNYVKHIGSKMRCKREQTYPKVKREMFNYAQNWNKTDVDLRKENMRDAIHRNIKRKYKRKNERDAQK